MHGGMKALRKIRGLVLATSFTGRGGGPIKCAYTNGNLLFKNLGAEPITTEL
jgi:hypothetical protein